MKNDKVYYLIPALNVVNECNTEFKYVCHFNLTKHLIKENINDMESGIDYIDLYTGLYWEGDERDIYREILIVPTFMTKNNNSIVMNDNLKNKIIDATYKCLEDFLINSRDINPMEYKDTGSILVYPDEMVIDLAVVIDNYDYDTNQIKIYKILLKDINSKIKGGFLK